MRSADIVAQMALALPALTEKFTTNFSITSLTRSGTTVTATTSAAHGLAVGKQVNVIGAQTPLSIGTLTRVGTVGTLVTDNRHDMTENFSTEVEIVDAVEAEFNDTFVLLTVPNRKTITFTMADTGATTATGSPLLLNGSSALQQYNGLKNVTAVPTATQFQYEITDSTLFTPASGTIIARTLPRISAAVSEERLLSAYTKQPQGDLWAFVVLEDVFASKNRNIESDATDNIQRGDQYRQQIIQPFTVYVFIPTKGEIAARDARDVAEDIFRPICRSLLFKPFSGGLYAGKQGPVQFVNHGFIHYDSAFYVHGYNFQQVVDITFEDTVGYDLDVAFRDISVTMGVSTGSEVMTAEIDLDEDPLP